MAGDSSDLALESAKLSTVASNGPQLPNEIICDIIRKRLDDDFDFGFVYHEEAFTYSTAIADLSMVSQAWAQEVHSVVCRHTEIAKQAWTIRLFVARLSLKQCKRMPRPSLGHSLRSRHQYRILRNAGKKLKTAVFIWSYMRRYERRMRGIVEPGWQDALERASSEPIGLNCGVFLWIKNKGQGCELRRSRAGSNE